MTVADWWERIEEFTRAGDWNGVLVAADALQELGNGRDAEGLRWLIQNSCQPTYDVGWGSWKCCIVYYVGGLRKSESCMMYDTRHRRKHYYTGGVYGAWRWLIDKHQKVVA